MASDAESTWERMRSGRGKPPRAEAPADSRASAADASVDPSTSKFPVDQSSPATSPSSTMAAAARWAAVGVLGCVAISAVVWVVLSNRTRPAVVPPRGDATLRASSLTGQKDASPVARHGSLLDLNTATAAELDRLPGIGPALAARIVEDRQKHGRYNSLEHLDRVQGIGPKTIEKLRPYLTVP